MYYAKFLFIATNIALYIKKHLAYSKLDLKKEGLYLCLLNNLIYLVKFAFF